MKELSIEEKAKAYDEALKVLHKYDGANIMFSQSLKEEMFPELKESEDERIRKAIGYAIGQSTHSDGTLINGVSSEEALAWLEKQGEQKFADKVELKVFKIGDIITNGILIGKIDEINEFGYHAYFGDYYASVPDIENWHKWTIQDAKDGDVLVCESGWTCIFKKLNHNSFGEILFDSYCFIDRTGWFCNGAKGHTLNERINGKIYPATKEQREQLEKAITDAGFMWDAEKKELKKIEQKPAWSEEDESIMNAIYKFLDGSDALSVDQQQAKYWLKSLKERVQPKQEWKQENTHDLTDFENVMMHIGDSFFGQYAGLDPNDTNSIKEQAAILLGLVPKQEWSEEDEKIYQSIMDDTVQENQLSSNQTNWLRDIKYRYFPQHQNTLKVSDEQIKALKEACNEHWEPDGLDPLYTLYQNLKKLREE